MINCETFFDDMLKNIKQINLDISDLILSEESLVNYWNDQELPKNKAGRIIDK